MPGDAADPVSQQSMHVLGVLARGIAHDLNNLLQTVLGTAEAALDHRPLAAETAGALRDICLCAGQGASLLQQILYFGRGHASATGWIAVDAALDRAARLLQPNLPDQILLSVTNDHAPLFVRIDTARLDQIVLNLAINARDAMPDGGLLRIHSHLHNPDAPVSSYVAIDVSDTGTGIPPEVQPLIFKPFFTTRGREGGGLGLGIVADIVQAAGGRITLESTGPDGTRFRVLLPCLLRAAA